MKRLAWALGALLALSALAWRAAKFLPPAFFSRKGAAAQLTELEEILRSKNDNDARLDRDFNDLSSEARKAFRAKYRSLPPESLNERGTILYLLGRSLKTAEDWDFLRQAAAEPPCLSLADCSRASDEPGAQGDAVTLSYPSLVALKQAQKALEAGDAAAAAGARGVVEAGLTSKAPIVRRLASALQQRLNRPG